MLSELTQREGGNLTHRVCDALLARRCGALSDLKIIAQPQQPGLENKRLADSVNHRYGYDIERFATYGSGGGDVEPTNFIFIGWFNLG